MEHLRTRIERLPDDVVAVDTFTGGMSQVTAGHLIAAPRPALVESGPALSVGHLVAGLREIGFDPDDLAYLIVTHIHLDHAGGAGDIAEAFPRATVVVNEVGARHLKDPSRLNASARRVYGPLFDSVYGECSPVDGDRILAVEDGHEIDLGGGRTLEMLYTPGHAKHHIGIWDAATGTIFSGDSVGVRLPGMQHIRPSTPPPDFHLGAADRSLRRYAERNPSRVYLAHYGPLDDPAEELNEAMDRLHLWAETAEAAYAEHDELDHVAETLAQRLGDDTEPSLAPHDEHVEDRVELLSGFESNAAGLLRYFRRRDAGELTETG